MSILVVEDDYTNQQYLRILLEKYDDVDIVEDGTAGFEKFKEAQEQGKAYKIIFVDVVTPKMDGNQMTAQIRAWEKDHQSSERTLVIIESARVMVDEIAKSVEAGCDLFLPKPFRIEELDGFMFECGFVKKPKKTKQP